MNSFGVTTPYREHAVLKTTGLGPCIGVVLYEPMKKVAGLFHLTIPLDVAASGIPLWNSVHEDVLALIAAMQRNGVTYDDRINIQATLLGGYDSRDLPPLRAIVETRLGQLGITNIALGETRGKGATPLHIAVDSRDGKVYRLTNIRPRKHDDDIFKYQMRGMTPHVTSDSRSLK